MNPLKTVLLLFLFTILTAPALASKPEVDYRLSTYLGITDNYSFLPFFGTDNQDDFAASLSLRTMVSGDVSKSISYEIHADQQFGFNTALSTTSAFEGHSYRALDATLDWLDGDYSSARLHFDRFSFRFALKKMDITIGRQAISPGKAYFWNPMDIFMPFDPQQFDRDYKGGVDAIRLDYYTGPYSGFSFIAAPAADESAPGIATDRKSFAADIDGSAFLARYFTSAGGWDYSVQAGSIADGLQFGAGAVGNTGDYQLRLEATYFDSRDSAAMPFGYTGLVREDALTASIGAGRIFSNFPGMLDVEVEYLYNEAGASARSGLDAAFIRQSMGAIPHMGRHLFGANITYEFTPLQTGSLAVIYSFTDNSAMLQPGYLISLTDNSDILFGATITAGRRPAGAFALAPRLQSEFGAWPSTYYTQYRLYF